jgi:hypothetical protein
LRTGITNQHMSLQNFLQKRNGMGVGYNLLLIGLQLTNATTIHTKFAYPYKHAHSSKFALSLPNHFNTAHNPTGTNAVYPYTSPAAPLSNLKSYTNLPSPFCAKYWLIVPVRNKITTTVVAIHTGP